MPTRVILFNLLNYSEQYLAIEIPLRRFYYLDIRRCIYAYIIIRPNRVNNMCPSLHGLQEMVNICADFGTDYHITFNDKKTTCIMFGTSAAGFKCIIVNDNEIMWSNRVKHLGNVINCDLSDVADSNSKKGHFIASVNWFVSHFSGQVPLDCYIRLFQTYCSSHYGSVLWQLNGRGFNSFCISWNKGVRRVLGIPYKTHTALLGPIIDSCHVSIVLVKRFCKFVDSMLTSDNEIVTEL